MKETNTSSEQKNEMSNRRGKILSNGGDTQVLLNAVCMRCKCKHTNDNRIFTVDILSRTHFSVYNTYCILRFGVGICATVAMCSTIFLEFWEKRVPFESQNEKNDTANVS